jgi:hypothetical protein
MIKPGNNRRLACYLVDEKGKIVPVEGHKEGAAEPAKRQRNLDWRRKARHIGNSIVSGGSRDFR